METEKIIQILTEMAGVDTIYSYLESVSIINFAEDFNKSLCKLKIKLIQEEI